MRCELQTVYYPLEIVILSPLGFSLLKKGPPESPPSPPPHHTLISTALFSGRLPTSPHDPLVQTQFWLSRLGIVTLFLLLPQSPSRCSCFGDRTLSFRGIESALFSSLDSLSRFSLVFPFARRLSLTGDIQKPLNTKPIGPLFRFRPGVLSPPLFSYFATHEAFFSPASRHL